MHYQRVKKKKRLERRYCLRSKKEWRVEEIIGRKKELWILVEGWWMMNIGIGRLEEEDKIKRKRTVQSSPIIKEEEGGRSKENELRMLWRNRFMGVYVLPPFHRVCCTLYGSWGYPAKNITQDLLIILCLRWSSPSTWEGCPCAMIGFDFQRWFYYYYDFIPTSSCYEQRLLWNVC